MGKVQNSSNSVCSNIVFRLYFFYVSRDLPSSEGLEYKIHSGVLTFRYTYFSYGANECDELSLYNT
jgi:hypothetical protein